MILDYKQYVNKIESLKTELNKVRDDVRRSIIIDLENEFSKYLKKTRTTDFDYNGSNVFLLDDNYGIRIILDSDCDYGTNVNVRINIIYKSANTKNIFKTGNYDPKNIFKTGKDSIEDFVFRYVEILNKKYLARQNDIQRRELNKVAKKFNL